jgi:uncharacterized protein YggE
MSSLMTRRAVSFVAVLAAAVAFVVVGLSRHGTDPVHAAVDATSPDTVTVTGVGTADGAPDTLNANFRVHVVRATVQEAIDAQSAAARRVLAALAKAGVAGKRVTTTDLSIDERYNNNGIVTGYEASETVQARISPLNVAGRTISAAATASGNDVTVDGLSFDIADDDPLVARARTHAFADAHGRASQYAGLAGRSLGRVMSIKERIDRAGPTPYPYADALFAKSAAGSPGVPIRGGRQTLAVRVAVVWALN